MLLSVALLAPGLAAASPVEGLNSIPRKGVPSGIVVHQFAFRRSQAGIPSTPAKKRSNEFATAPITKVVPSRSPRSGVVPMAPPQRSGGASLNTDSRGELLEGPIPYTRSAVTEDYREFPISTNGKLFIRFTAGSRTCSGTVVHSGPDNHRSVVFTAARCIYRESLGGWAQEVTFVPAYTSTSAPFGEWPARDVFVPKEWVDGGENPHFDVAALYIPPAASGEILEKDYTGGMGLRWNQGFKNQPTEAFAYPGTPFTGQRLYRCVSETRSNLPQPPGVGDPMLATGCDLPQEGTAGGGWIVHDPAADDSFLTSVFSEKPRNETEVSLGPYFGSTVAGLYRAAVNPTAHRMSITLRLKGHLRALGRIKARDGYKPCRIDAPIRIQRKKSGKWRTVRRTHSRSTGDYKVRLPDRRGRYRAFSPAGLVDDDNRCSAAKSGTRRY